MTAKHFQAANIFSNEEKQFILATIKGYGCIAVKSAVQRVYYLRTAANNRNFSNQNLQHD